MNAKKSIDGGFVNTDDTSINGSQSEAEILEELQLIYEACLKTGLPKPLQKPVNKTGRPAFNRFILLTLIIFGLKREWSFRQIEKFARENLELLRKIDPAIKKAPDHSLLYLSAKKLRLTHVNKIIAKTKELRGEVPVLWY